MAGRGDGAGGDNGGRGQRKRKQPTFSPMCGIILHLRVPYPPKSGDIDIIANRLGDLSTKSRVLTALWSGTGRQLSCGVCGICARLHATPTPASLGTPVFSGLKYVERRCLCMLRRDTERGVDER